METKRQLKSDELEIASVVRPCRGERVSGDTAVIEQRDGILFLAVIDALGHGPQANQVAEQAERFLRKHWGRDVLNTMHRLDSALKGTIGACAGLCVVDKGRGELRYTGVGNTVFRTFGSRSTRMVSADGIIGIRFRTPAVQAAALDASDTILMYSDGVSDRFDVEQYPQIHHHSASAIAHTVVDRFGKPYDDATCLAMRHGR